MSYNFKTSVSNSSFVVCLVLDITAVFNLSRIVNSCNAILDVYCRIETTFFLYEGLRLYLISAEYVIAIFLYRDDFIVFIMISNDPVIIILRQPSTLRDEFAVVIDIHLRIVCTIKCIINSVYKLICRIQLDHNSYVIVDGGLNCLIVFDLIRIVLKKHFCPEVFGSFRKINDISFSKRSSFDIRTERAALPADGCAM